MMRGVAGMGSPPHPPPAPGGERASPAGGAYLTIVKRSDTGADRKPAASSAVIVIA